MGRGLANSDEYSTDTTLALALGRAAPAVVGLTRERLKGYSLISITFRSRPGSLLGIIRAVRDQDGANVVCFGAGRELSDALVALSKGLQRGDWRPDRYG